MSKKWEAVHLGGSFSFQMVISKSTLKAEIDWICEKLDGIPAIRVHGLPHSHVSILVYIGYSAIASVGGRWRSCLQRQMRIPLGSTSMNSVITVFSRVISCSYPM